ncbi:PKP4, partial [Cordylochernes scorpioides]
MVSRWTLISLPKLWLQRALKNAGGIPALVHLLRKSTDNEIRELITGILWNLSSCEDLKRPIIDDALTVLVNQIIIPHSGWDRTLDFSSQSRHRDIPWSTVFRNASGVLRICHFPLSHYRVVCRNVSSAGEYARKRLRECEGLVESVLHLVHCAVGKNDMDNKGVENCVCILRNLSYRCQEVEDPDYDKSLPPNPTRASAASLKAVGDNLGCFGVGRKKSSSGPPHDGFQSGGGRGDGVVTVGPRRRGMALLWQPEVVQLYLSILSDCSNADTLEAAAGAIQNLAACYWPPSVDIRAAIRKEKGLLILLDLLRMDVDKVVCAVATAARNLAMDHCNKELIVLIILSVTKLVELMENYVAGKYAMRDLVHKLPNGNPQNEERTSDDTIAAVLATLNEVILHNSEFSRALLEAGGIERLMYISRQKPKFSPRVLRFTHQVHVQLLYNMWAHQELREVYKKAGWKEAQFVGGSSTPGGPRKSPVTSGTNTISRPFSSQGGTKYEDKTLPRHHHNNISGGEWTVAALTLELAAHTVCMCAGPHPQYNR